MSFVIPCLRHAQSAVGTGTIQKQGDARRRPPARLAYSVTINSAQICEGCPGEVSTAQLSRTLMCLFTGCRRFAPLQIDTVRITLQCKVLVVAAGCGYDHGMESIHQIPTHRHRRRFSGEPSPMRPVPFFEFMIYGARAYA